MKCLGWVSVLHCYLERPSLLSLSCSILITFSGVFPHCGALPVRKLFSFEGSRGTDYSHPFIPHLGSLHSAVTGAGKIPQLVLLFSACSGDYQLALALRLIRGSFPLLPVHSQDHAVLEALGGLISLTYILDFQRLLPPRLMVNVVHEFLALFPGCSGSFYVGI